MQTQLATLAQASVLQLRDALRRVTAAHVAAAPEELDAQALLSGVEVSESSWAEWEETVIDVRQIRG